MPALVVEDVLGVEVEGAERGERRDEHPHRVGVVVEPVDEPLAHVLVDERVVGDVVGPRLQLRLVGQLAVQQEVGDLEVRRVLGELLDGIAAVAQDAGVAVEVGDLRLARRRRQVGRVVHEQGRVELAERRAGEHAVGDRDRHGLAGAVVGDRDGVGHRVPFVAHGTARDLKLVRMRAPVFQGVLNTARCRACVARAASRLSASRCEGVRRARRRVSAGSITASM